MGKELGLDSKGAYVKISVVDTGAGMDEEVMGKIFDPFFTTKQMEGGTGLGLATAYGIVKSHGGAFRVLSSKGQGSSFALYLPAFLRSAPEEKNENRTNHAVVSGNGSVLLVDDEASVIEVCTEMLTTLGYEVFSAQRGVDALDILQQNSLNIDLVILDMVMPGMSGDEVFRQIKAIDPEARVLIASGYSQKHHVEQLIGQGADGFIQKPFDLAMLSEQIRLVCLP
ncbi:MAG: response regulator [Desulfobacteraceae bacterium]